MEYKRSERVGDLVKKEIASMVQHGDIRDPRVGFVTILRVDMAPDMKSAKVFFSMMGSDREKSESENGLNSASGFMRRALAGRLKLRHIPTLRFIFDDSLEYADHIDRVIKDMKGEGSPR